MNHRRVAAIDCGTNSIRLLVAEIRPDGGLRDVVRTMRIVRLGQDVDRTGRLSAAALARTEVAMREYAGEIAAADADAVRMVATSAVRDAANREDFVALARGVLGTTPEVLSGPAEARLSFIGAVSGTGGAGFDGVDTAGGTDSARRAGTGERGVVVVDIGGGSTEIVWGDRRSLEVGASVSLDVGSVRLTERHIRDDPPTSAQLSAVSRDVLDALHREVAASHPMTDMMGLAGTVTTVAALALGLRRYDSDRVHGAVLTSAQIERAVGALTTMDRTERSACGVVHPGRVDVIAAGAVILRTVMHHLKADRVQVSEHDILDGVALSLR